jgi:hypothetical protein
LRPLQINGLVGVVERVVVKDKYTNIVCSSHRSDVRTVVADNMLHQRERERGGGNAKTIVVDALVHYVDVVHYVYRIV